MSIDLNTTFDIVGFIEKNPIVKFSKEYQSKFINKIIQSFTDNQQQLFVTSFFCYLNYNTKTDFIINLDDIWKWLGFSRKDHSKTLLLKHFKEGDDFSIQKAAPVCSGASNTGGAGLNKEKIMMSVNTFKKMCIKANTSKADEIHEYYIKLEEVLHEIMDEENRELRLDLLNKENTIKTKDLELSNKDNTIKTIAKQKKLLENKICRNVARVQYKDRNVIYIITSRYHLPERIYMIGKAVKLTDRLSSYNRTVEHEAVFYRACNSGYQMRIVELMVLMVLDKYREVKSRDRFILPEGQELSLFIKAINDVIDLLVDVDESVNIENNYTEEEKIESVKERKSLYNEDNKEYISEQRQNFRDDHKEEIALQNKIYYEENKEVISEKHQIYRDNNKEKIAEIAKEYYEENKDQLNIKTKIWKENNKERLKESAKEYHEKNRDEILKKNKVKTTCECGIVLNASGLSRHKKSVSHKKLMSEKKSGHEEELDEEEVNERKEDEEEVNERKEDEEEVNERKEDEEEVNERKEDEEKEDEFDHEVPKKERIKGQKTKEMVICECGLKIVKYSLDRHKKSKIHENCMKLILSNLNI